MSKYFLVNPNLEFSEKDNVQLVEEQRVQAFEHGWKNREQKAKEALINNECTLKWVTGKVIIKVDMQMKNNYTFEDGTTIRRERGFNNFNFREVNPSNAIVVSAENIPSGVEILVDYTAIHDSYRIFDYNSGSEDVQYYSIREEDCYAWRDDGSEFQPTKNFEFGLRIFIPYSGLIQGIEPTVMKDTLYVTTGNLKGNVVRTLKGCDYVIVFTDAKGKEGNLIRFRHSENENFDREEVILINHELTEKVLNGKLFVGLDAKTAKSVI